MFNQKGSSLIIIIIGIVFLIAAIYVTNLVMRFNRDTKLQEQKDIENQQYKQEETSQRMKITDIKTWEVYKDSKYGFEIMHPLGSSVETNENDAYQYVRIQNYTDEEVNNNFGKLKDGQYYLEISIYDHTVGKMDSPKCKGLLKDESEINLGAGVKGYKGSGYGQSDSSNFNKALCINRSSVDYYIQASEESSLVSQKIIDSFKFTK